MSDWTDRCARAHERLERYLAASYLTQGAVARLMGVSRSLLAKFATGRFSKQPTATNLKIVTWIESDCRLFILPPPPPPSGESEFDQLHREQLGHVRQAAADAFGAGGTPVGALKQLVPWAVEALENGGTASCYKKWANVLATYLAVLVHPVPQPVSVEVASHVREALEVVKCFLRRIQKTRAAIKRSEQGGVLLQRMESYAGGAMAYGGVSIGDRGIAEDGGRRSFKAACVPHEPEEDFGGTVLDVLETMLVEQAEWGDKLYGDLTHYLCTNLSRPEIMREFAPRLRIARLNPLENRWAEDAPDLVRFAEKVRAEAGDEK